MSSKTPDVSIGDASIKTSTKETLLGILTDSELSFDEHISSICSKVTKKLHALGRIASFRSFNKRKTLIKAFVESHVSSFDELLKKGRSFSIHHRNIQSLAI